MPLPPKYPSVGPCSRALPVMDWGCQRQGTGNSRSVTPPCTSHGWRFRWGLQVLEPGLGRTQQDGLGRFPLQPQRLNLGSVRRRGKDGGFHRSWQPWERDPGVHRQSQHPGRAEGYLWSTGEKRTHRCPSPHCQQEAAPAAVGQAAAPGDGWLTPACHASALWQLLVPPCPQGGNWGWHELGHTGMPWLQYLAGGDGGILKAGTGLLSQGLGGSGKGKIPAGHKPVGNIGEQQQDMQGNRPVLIPDPRWGWGWD